jgi:hypothetical protein
MKDKKAEDRGWLAASACVPGRSHLRSGTPCQDAAATGICPRPWLIVCDGRGSASHSDTGATAAVEAIRAQIDNAGELFAKVLDGDDEEEAQRCHPLLIRLIYRTAAQEQRRQAARMGASPEDFEHTLLAVVCGNKRFLYIQVGDGGIVMQRRDGSLQVLSEPARGEFANTTFFVTCGRQTNWRHGLLPMEGVAGFMAFSDGTAEKLVVIADNTAAPAVGQILERAVAGRFGREEILRFLTEPHWEPGVQDDRSLAILVVGSGTASDNEPVLGEEPIPGVPAFYHDEGIAGIGTGQVPSYWRRHREILAVIFLATWVPVATVAGIMALGISDRQHVDARTATPGQSMRMPPEIQVKKATEVPAGETPPVPGIPVPLAIGPATPPGSETTGPWDQD